MIGEHRRIPRGYKSLGRGLVFPRCTHSVLLALLSESFSGQEMLVLLPKDKIKEKAQA